MRELPSRAPRIYSDSDVHDSACSPSSPPKRPVRSALNRGGRAARRIGGRGVYSEKRRGEAGKLRLANEFTGLARLSSTGTGGGSSGSRTLRPFSFADRRQIAIRQSNV